MVESIQKEEYTHDSVLLSEVCENLELAKKRNVVDATLGLGGHARAILGELKKNGKIIGFDADASHIKLAKKKLRSFKDRVVYINSNFCNLTEELKKARIRSIDAFVFDLGIALPHIENPERGFSFMNEGELDMRFDSAQQLTAAEVVNKYSEKELARIFKEFGEDKNARKIALAIRKTRKTKPFKTTTQLAKFIEDLVGRSGRIHPATRIFQALRIEVNKELDVLVDALNQAFSLLNKDGRIAVISYHSLEDRIVKNMFRDLARCEKPQLRIITKKPIVPTSEEISLNPRSRSAKLRVAEKI